jgi:LuxR family maltose regulon positive regulatory protein
MKVLEQASLVARERNLVRLTGLTSAWRVELLARSGYVSEARREAAAANLESIINENELPHFGWRVRVASTIATAEIYFASGTSAQAWHLLNLASGDFLRAGLILAARQMQAHGLLALKEHPDNNPMVRDLEECLDFIAKEGGDRIILDCGVGIESVLQNALKDTSRFSGPRRVVLDSLLKEIRKEKNGPRDEFSAAELKMLRELRLGRPNKAIARTLDISENTVKFHLKNIYRKLDANSRLSAIAAALERNLFEL